MIACLFINLFVLFLSFFGDRQPAAVLKYFPFKIDTVQMYLYLLLIKWYKLV